MSVTQAFSPNYFQELWRALFPPHLNFRLLFPAIALIVILAGRLLCRLMVTYVGCSSVSLKSLSVPIPNPITLDAFTIGDSLGCRPCWHVPSPRFIFLLAPLSSPAQFPSTSLASLKKLLIRSKEGTIHGHAACVKNSNLTRVIRFSRKSYFTENVMAKKRFIRNEPKTYRFMKWSSRWVAIGACGTDDRTTV